MMMNRFLKTAIRKQFRAVLCCLLAVGVLLSCLCYTVIERLITKNAAIHAQSTAQKFNAEVEFLFERVDALFSSLLFDKNIEQMLHAPFSANTPAYLNALHTQFSSYSLMNQDLAEIALVSRDMTWSNYFDAASLRRFSAELEGVYGSVCLGLHTSPLNSASANKDPQLVFGHNVYGMHEHALYGRYLGSIVLSLNLAKSSITLPAGDPSSPCFILLDQYGAAFPFNCTQEQYLEIQRQSLAAGGGQWPGETFHTRDYLVYTAPLADTGLVMISAMDRHALSGDVFSSAAILVGITLAALALIVWLMRLILQGMVQPLSQLAGHIEHIKSTPPGAPARPLQLEGCEEIARLSSSFNSMLAEQARLNRELQQTTVNLYETQLGRKQAELEYLRSQINPHFLYNTLEAIQGLAVQRGVPEIADAAGALGKLFRHNIQGSAIIPLREELEITQAYLTIQKLRFPDKLNVLVSVRENTRELPVMKLLLQPLVENAVYHGLEPKTGPGTLFLGAQVESGTLLISVYDDGVGIPPKALAALRKALDSPVLDREEKDHIGLLNVQRRIRLRYGAPYGLALQSTPGEGTRITVRLPVHPPEKEGGSL